MANGELLFVSLLRLTGYAEPLRGCVRLPVGGSGFDPSRSYVTPCVTNRKE